MTPPFGCRTSVLEDFPCSTIRRLCKRQYSTLRPSSSEPSVHTVVRVQYISIFTQYSICGDTTSDRTVVMYGIEDNEIEQSTHREVPPYSSYQQCKGRLYRRLSSKSSWRRGIHSQFARTALAFRWSNAMPPNWWKESSVLFISALAAFHVLSTTSC